MKTKAKIFFSYAYYDEKLRKQLEKHLDPLKKLGFISDCCDREIGAGMDREREIEKQLNTASIILLLVSPDFLASDYCYGKEMEQALRRHKAGEARVIPVILRPADWKDTPIGGLQALPDNAKPVTTWRNRDEAFFKVAKGIRKAVEEL